MKIVVCPDSWKDCLPAHLVAAAMQSGIEATGIGAQIVCKPMADGGQGTVEALVRATGGTFVVREVTGPLGEPVQARYGILGDGKTAVIEMAAAAGLELVPIHRRNPLWTTTIGVGELLLAAAERGARRIILGIGGSATNDGGAGLLAALGFRLFDEHGNAIQPMGGLLRMLDRIDSTSRTHALDGIQLDVACDVTNPLLGPTGASGVFGPQKGADEEAVQRLERGLTHFAHVVERDLGKKIAQVPGSGAAGGLGAGLLAGTNAVLKRGVELVIDAVGLREDLRGADLCLTGEGSFDAQSSFGKTAIGVGRVCKELRVPCIVIAGAVELSIRGVHDEGVTAYFSAMQKPATLQEAVAEGPRWIAHVAEQAVRLFVRTDASAPSGSR